MKTLETGNKLPAFIAEDQNGNTIDSTQLTGKKTVIYFYPKDNTPGCTSQACSIRDGYQELLQNNIQVIGVSADSLQSHQKFTTKFELPFPLIPDVDRKIIEAFGVWGPKKFMGKEYDGIHRMTFLFNEEGILLKVIQKPDTKNHAEEILKTFGLK